MNTDTHHEQPMIVNKIVSSPAASANPVAQSNSEATQHNEFAFEQLSKMKDEGEKMSWIKRGIIRFFEIVGFAGLFLCTNPIGFYVSLAILLLALAADYILGYSDFKTEKMWDKIAAMV